MSATTTADLIRAATSVARDVSDGKLDPAALEAEMLTELRDLFVVVVGPEDPLWPIQTDVARQVVSRGGIEANELGEWLAVQRRRENPDAPSEVLSAAVPLDGSTTSPEVVSDGSVAHSPENDDLPDDLADVPREVIVRAEAAAMSVITEWRASR
ncbi:hypothetical protein [Mycobacteroides chelonae]|uniref:hypothetical protein n=1 Tax=Mycobacteroides chelonae TaxID=1774 RepID=UPI0008A93D0D|nr:hypothetical protein [Mycobacteroides chelonae]OHT54091.1 hypothetical protein BKG63_07400 [Mycobacteroides chelonae]OHT99864.1 hypothetical protein BKG72_05715 [Mycobacteroides chelonae]OLT86550.1 hypothetical protein BKG59_22380 [Mycobacteroides chelonae]